MLNGVVHVRRKIIRILAIAFAILIAIAPSTHANSKNDKTWYWSDRNGHSYDRTELDRILDLHREWVNSRHKMGQRADLQGAKLAGADLSGAELSGLDLSGTDLSNAEMSGIIIGEASAGPPVPNPPMMLSMSAMPDPNPPNSTYLDLLAYFAKALIRPSPKAVNECDWKSVAHPNATDLSQARLVGAVLKNTHFYNTNLSGADLSGAKMGGAQFVGVEFRGAKMSGAFVNHGLIYQSHIFAADLSNADFTSTSFWGSDLNVSDLTGAKLDNSNFSEAEVCKVNFEPETIPSDIPSLASAHGLQFLESKNGTYALVALRGRFRDQGFRDQERKLTYAIKQHEAAGYWLQCVSGSASECFEFAINEFLFDWTCEYGLNPERALRILIGVWFFCGAIYWILIRFPRSGGLYITPPGLPITSRLRHMRIRRLRPRTPLIYPTATSGSDWSRIGANSKAILFREFRRLDDEWGLFLTSLFFSTMSALNIGFKGVAAGRWVRLLTTRDYDILALGWPRVVAGLQSILCVGLLALWLLTLFGRPFG